MIETASYQYRDVSSLIAQAFMTTRSSGGASGTSRPRNGMTRERWSMSSPSRMSRVERKITSTRTPCFIAFDNHRSATSFVSNPRAPSTSRTLRAVSGRTKTSMSRVPWSRPYTAEPIPPISRNGMSAV